MRISPFAPCALALLSVAACVTDEEPSPGSLRLVTTVERETGNRVEFYVDPEGALVLSEELAATGTPSLSWAQARRAHPVAVYRAIAPDRAPPSELLELATAGGYDLRADPAATLILDGADRPAPDRLARSASWFTTNVCDVIDDLYEKFDLEFSWCLKNLEGDSQINKNDVNDISVAVCSDRGEIDLESRIRYRREWQTDTWTIDDGRCRSWWRSAGARDYDVQSRIRRAAGDRYHHGGAGCYDGAGIDPTCPLPAYF